MKKIMLGLFLVFLFFNSYSQNRFGVEVGGGVPYLNTGLLSGANYTATINPVLNISGYYIRRMNRNIYLGVRCMYNHYDFIYAIEQSDSLKKIGGSIVHNSSWIMIAPTFDMGIDNKQILHGYVSLAYGVNVNGTQNNSTFTNISGGSFTEDRYKNDLGINKSIIQIDFGLIQHLRIGEDWHLTINESYGIMIGRITGLDYPVNQTMGISPGYFNLLVGVMYKYLYTGWAARYDEDD